MKENTMKLIIAVLAVLLLAGVTAYAATNYGSKNDPLITKSYLDEVVKPELESELQSKLDAAAADMLRSAPGEFTKVELGSGRSMYCAAGCQLLPVSGSITASGMLADTTMGSAVAAGTALSANHLYLTTEDGTVTAADSAAVLVSGAYRVD